MTLNVREFDRYKRKLESAGWTFINQSDIPDSEATLRKALWLVVGTNQWAFELNWNRKGMSLPLWRIEPVENSSISNPQFIFGTKKNGCGDPETLAVTAGGNFRTIATRALRQQRKVKNGLAKEIYD